jgi:hypothetical protein
MSRFWPDSADFVPCNMSSAIWGTPLEGSASRPVRVNGKAADADHPAIG